ncbi:hypothetical protein ACSBR1_036803 [Camellia fascicularis]
MENRRDGGVASEQTKEDQTHDLHSILSSSERDFLIRNNGDLVKFDSLKGKKVGLYFSASWCGPCQQFTPNLVEVYNELSSKGNFEIVFVSADEDEEALKGGKVSTDEGVEIIHEYGVDAYPFSSKRVKELKDQEEAARREQSLKSILVSREHDFVISADGKEVSVSELEGKTVGLYFSVSSYKKCLTFTPKLIEVYEELKSKGEKFELARYFELSSLPSLVIIGPDGKTLRADVVETVEEHGTLAYPFTPEKFAELEEIEKAKREAQTSESILVPKDLDFVIGKDGLKVPVSDLVGKTILIYFSAHWCPPCRAFLPKLVEAYQEIKAKDDAFKVIFISSDKDQASFEDFFSTMPWLAHPFGDERKESLSRTLKVRGIPMLVALDPKGRTVTTEARELVMYHGADAYPFTKERLKEIEAQQEEMAKGWPEKVKAAVHVHELVLTRHERYFCDGCEEQGRVWSFYCGKCDFDLHLKCALEEAKGTKGDAEEVGEGKKGEEGWVCDGEVCTKA